MGSELSIAGLTATVAVAWAYRASDDLIWNANTAAFEAYNDTSRNAGHYDIALVQQSDSMYWVGDFPTAITASGVYNISFYKAAGTFGAYTYTFIVAGQLNWNGSGESFTPTDNSLTTVSFVKARANITSSAYDGFFTNAIAECSDVLQTILGVNFALQDYVENVDGANSSTLKLTNVPVTAISQVTIDQYTTTPIVIPGTEFVINSKAGIISLKPKSTYWRWFGYTNNQDIKVEYSAGYSAIPLAVQGVVAAAVIKLWKTSNKDLTLSSYKLGDESYVRREDTQRMFSDDLLGPVWCYRVNEYI